MSDVTPIATIAKGRGSEVRVSLNVFEGRRLIDVRTFVANDESKALSPTKKGVALAVDRLGDLREALAKAEAEALRLGWLQGGAA